MLNKKPSKKIPSQSETHSLSFEIPEVENKTIKETNNNTDTAINKNNKTPDINPKKRNSGIKYNETINNDLNINTNMNTNTNANANIVLMNMPTLEDERINEQDQNIQKENKTNGNGIRLKMDDHQETEQFVVGVNTQDKLVNSETEVVNVKGFNEVITHNLTTNGAAAKEYEVPLCKICYEQSSEEKPIYRPCKCQGSMQYIHLECLKHWVGDKDVTVEKPNCEICMYEYRLLFEYEYHYSHKKTMNMMKNLLLVVIVSIVILVLLDVLIMVIIGSVTLFTDELKEKILHVIVGISCGIIVVILLTYFRDFKENYFNKEVVNWTVKDYEIGNKYQLYLFYHFR